MMVVALRGQALALEKQGDSAGAFVLFDQALALAPSDAALVNSGAGQALRMGAIERAVLLFRRAVALEPDSVEFTINLAIALGRAGQSRAAIGALRAVEHIAAGEARYWSVRAAQERLVFDLDAAATSFERCLALNPDHALALHGRARVALERGESDAHARYAQAVAADPANPEVWLGRAMALDSAGAPADAQRIAVQITEAAPAWIPGQRLRAELSFAHDEHKDFAAHFDAAIAADAQAAPDLYLAWCEALSGAAQHHRAAAIAARALAASADDPRVQLMAAATASRIGDLDRADALFARLGENNTAVRVTAARHWLRSGDPRRAEHLLAAHLAEQPESIDAWALRSLAWRVLDDPREEWLHGQRGLIDQSDLVMGAAEFERVIAVLDRLHNASTPPIGQSVRGGSQTRGALFARLEPELRMLEAAVHAVLDWHRQGLPAQDESHPLLKHRDSSWRIAGSWSVRLSAQGHHEVHVHPQGVLSSALYLRLPPSDASDSTSGWLEVGSAPDDLQLGIAPMQLIKPQTGKLALFPSTLYHGTRPFAVGERMTVAFDVAPDSGG